MFVIIFVCLFLFWFFYYYCFGYYLCFVVFYDVYDYVIDVFCEFLWKLFVVDDCWWIFFGDGCFFFFYFYWRGDFLNCMENCIFVFFFLCFVFVKLLCVFWIFLLLCFLLLKMFWYGLYMWLELFGYFIKIVCEFK